MCTGNGPVRIQWTPSYDQVAVLLDIAMSHFTEKHGML